MDKFTPGQVISPEDYNAFAQSATPPPPDANVSKLAPGTVLSVDDYNKMFGGQTNKDTGAMSTIKHYAGQMADWLPMAGAVVGGAIPALMAPETGGVSLAAESAGVGLGTAAGVSLKGFIKSAIGDENAPSTMQTLKQSATEGVMGAGLNVVGGQILPALAKSANPAAAQLIKAFTGVDEKTAIRVLRDPDLLNRALPMEEAEKQFGNFIKNTGYKYGPEALKAVNGNKRISSTAIEDLTNSTLDTIESIGKTNKPVPPQLTQAALAARYSIQDLIKSAQVSGKNSLARSFIEDKSMVDDFLETQIPGFEKVRTAYSEAMAKEAFSPMLATNKNGTVSVLRSLGGIAESVYNPAKGIPMLAASSPYIAGKTIQGYAALAKLPIQQVRNMAAGGSAEAIEYLSGLDKENEKP